ncbi:hypothetical protein [Larkinella soli]|uniref:hypothetical protein n=1 Tax=Larkinella soli TaxID=1770527 RepID=UPI0013E2DDEC|nr:hypothetical protein [Larkinella soli]
MPLIEYPQNTIVAVRAFGYYLQLKDARRHRLLFSERNGYRGKRFGRYLLSWNKIYRYP